MSGSARAAGCRSRSSRPPASSQCLCWHMIKRGEDYAFARPSLTDEEAPGARAPRRHAVPPRQERQRPPHYSLKEVRRRERELAEQAEHAYRQLVADWQAKTPPKRPGVAAANGTRLKRPSAGQAARQASVPEPALRSGVDHAHTKA